MLNVWLLTSTWAFFVDGEVNRKANAVRLQAVENVLAIIQTTRVDHYQNHDYRKPTKLRRLLGAVFFG